MQPLDVAAYLARIGLAAAPTVDAEGLALLQRAHRRAIPFENLDIPLGRGISLDPAAVFDKLVTRRRGGYCFEHNGLLLPALQALGFTARPLLARVWLFAREVPPKTHTLSLVTIAGRDWIADAGFGGGDVPPMPLADGSEVVAAGVRHSLRHDPDHGWMLERNGERQYSFTEERVWPADLALANHWTASAPSSRFVQSRIASILTDGGLDTLAGQEVGGYRAALSKRFGIALSDAEVATLFPA